MKKILLSAFALVAMTLSAFAESKTIEFDFTAQGYANQQDFDGQTVKLGTGVSVTWSKGSGSTTPKYFTNGTAMRLYGGNTATFAATGNITSIVFTYSASYAATADNSAVSTGTYDYSSQTWTGSTKQLVLSYTAKGGRLQIQKVAVTFEAEASTTATFDDLYVPFKYDGTNFYDVKDAWANPVYDQANHKSEISFNTDNIDFVAVGGATPKDVDDPSAFTDWTAGWNDVAWNQKSQKLNDGATIFYAYVVGTGNPSVEDITPDAKTKDGVQTGWKAKYVFYAPKDSDVIDPETQAVTTQYRNKLPKMGLYYQFTAKKDGNLKIAVWANKGNRNTYLIDKATLQPVSYSCEGYIQGQTEPDPISGKNKFRWLTNDEIVTLHNNAFARVAAKNEDGTQKTDESGNPVYEACADTHPYVVGAGNQLFFGYFNMKLKAGQTYLLFQDNSQIGFGGFEFTDGTPAEGDLFSAEASVFLPSYIKAITNLVYNGDDTFTSTAGTEVTVQFTDSCKQYTLTGIKGTVTAPEGWTAVPANDGSTVVVSLNEGKAAKFVVTFTTESAETFSIANTTPGETTAIANVNASATVAPRKVLENGRILIGNYNIAGQRVK